MLSARLALRAAARPALRATVARPAALSAVRYSSHAAEESYEAFNARYASFFGSVTDLFELQRGLNNAFAYDLVPSVEVIENALRAARKVNDYATAVRILEGVKEKVENKGQYEQYLAALKPVIDELGIQTKEQLYNL
ncbi:Cytochrome c oxidase subunit 6 [Vanrija albida]|uniref:Cytochrome c oxidase subunit 6, mitochondrial n=1 Tax=Vanrija albida TaxID=181172 RepID=A0ABR3QC16_9TREE